MSFKIVTQVAVVLLALSFVIADHDEHTITSETCVDECTERDIAITHICTLHCGPNFTNLSYLQSLSPDDIFRTELLFSFNNLSVIEDDAFNLPALRNLSVIYLTNNHIQRIEPGAFKSLNETLSLVDLANNSLSTITNGIFSDFPKLRLLSLNSNQISSIEQGSFNGLSSLYGLDLSNNELTSLTNNMFEGATNLKTLDLEGNHITAIEPNALFGIIDMHIISFGFISVPSVPDQAFSLGSPLTCFGGDFQGQVEIIENNEFQNYLQYACVKPNSPFYPPENKIVQSNPWLNM